MPKTLYLMRHAKSSWLDPSMLDFDRPLNSRGERDAPEMGHRLVERNAIPEVVICSPARRAVETLEKLNLQLNIDPDSIFMQKRIYEASLQTLLEIVRSIDDRYASAMMIGHNPSMTWLASELGGEHIPNMPTCAVVAIGIDAETWSETGKAPAKPLFYDYPKNPD